MRNIHCLNNISPYGTDLLTDSYALTDDIESAQGILVRSAAMHDMEFSENLLAIARAGAGVNNIPLDRCAEEGIVVFNTPGANANAVKELVLASMLLGSRDIVGGIEWCRENADDPNIGKAAEKAKKQFAGREIQGKKLGVIGLGAIGGQVARAAVDLGMQVVGYDPGLRIENAMSLPSELTYVTDLMQIARVCDYVTIHVPAIPPTIGMINAEFCEAMKKGSVFLNFSRDTLVDLAAMRVALEEGRVAKYVTDFATPETMTMPNTIVLPHLGASTAEAEDNCAMMAVRQMMDYLDNGNIVNSVNYPALSMGPVPADCGRLGVLHKNVPNMIAELSTTISGQGLNIATLNNQSRGEVAYTLIDVDQEGAQAAADALAAIEGVFRVRLVK
ncbi:MAG: 3-phosphoglycerate dehydrogenase family protein [Coriobacteriia bacterium]|nr:3-phosphoglycerate dehydrogenase family protein [Coriobacteriia bacterium]